MWWQGGSGSALESSSGAFENTTTTIDSQDNFTLSCAARSIQDPVQQPYSDIIVTIVRVAQSLFLFFASFGGIFLNALVVFMVAKFKKLQTLSFGLAVQISALDILTSVNFVIGMVNAIANRWLFGEYVCGILGASLFFTGVVRTAVLFVFVFDRFLSVFVPLAYRKYQKLAVVISSIGSWMLVGLLVVIGFALDCYKFVPVSWICINSACNQNCSALNVVTSILLVPTTIISVILYVALFIKANKVKKAVASAYPNEKQPYNWKATITFFLLFLTAFAFILPNVIVAMVTGFLYGEEPPPLGVYLLAVCTSRLLTFIPTMDAIIVLRNKDIQEAGKDLKKKFICKQCPAIKGTQ